jgi:hypothetical protein
MIALPVTGCTIGIRHVGVAASISFFGVKMLGDLAQTHLVRKLIASRLIAFEFCIPPGMGQNRTWGMHTGICGINCLWDLGNRLGI